MEHHIRTPIKEADLRRMKVGDVIYLTGVLITARDEAHKMALDLHEKGEKLPVDFAGNAVFHCGPIMKKGDNGWQVVAAGPTTSTRMEIFQDKFIEAFRPSLIIGKGGMGERTSRACQKFGCVYATFTGGAALLAAKTIVKVKAVYWLEELGMPECLWVYESKDFGPLIVSIDTHGGNLTESVNKKVIANRDRLISEVT